MTPHDASCERCPLRDRPFVRGSGTTGGLMIIDEAPSLSDVSHQSYLSGVSGNLLKMILKQFNTSNIPIYVTAACLCRPPDQKRPPTEAIEVCRARLIEEIQSVNPRALLIMGRAAQQALYPEGKNLQSTRGLGTMIPINDHEIFGVITYSPDAVLQNDELARDIYADISKVFTRSAPYDLNLDATIEVIDNVETACRSLEEMARCDAKATISCDIETTGLDALVDRVLAIGFGVLSHQKYSTIILTRSIIYDSKVQDALREFFRSVRVSIVFHNMKFDLQFLEVLLGEKIRPLYLGDTLLMQYCIDERGGSEGGSSGYSFGTRGLKDQARIRYDVPDYHYDFDAFLKQTEESRDWTKFYQYLGKDCIFTLMLYQDLLRDFEDEPNLWSVMNNLLLPGTLALSDAELYGITVDVEYLRELEIKTSNRFEELQARLKEIAEPLGIKDFNPRSSPQKVALLEKCGVHTKSTAKEVVQDLLRKTSISDQGKEVLNLLSELQQLSGVLNTYIRGILSRLGPDNRIHPDFILHEAATGRLACRNPNLQNIPVLMGNQIRDAFTARPGYTLCDLDYSQLELRVAAYYSRDPELIRIFQEGLDIHVQVAAKMFGKPEGEVTKYERYLAKYVDFGIIYGRGAFSLANGWEMDHLRESGGQGWTVEEAEFFISEFLKSFKGLSSWMESQRNFVSKFGYVETPMGRRRRFPLLSPETIGHIHRKAVNSPIQSLASDICLMSLIRIAKILPPEAHIINTVHDSIMFEIPTELIPTLIPRISEEMSRRPPLLSDFNIPLVVGLGTGRSWGEMEKFSDDSNH